jgi:prepilin-type N-terminal cleavage/methylation domain-containing protein
MKINTSRRQGFTLVEIMIVVAIIGLLASIAVPNFVKARTTAQQKACISNLHQIDGAISTWAVEMNKGQGQAVTYSDISSYLKNAVSCPSGGSTFDDSYTISTVDAPPACQRVPSGPNAHVMAQTQ